MDDSEPLVVVEVADAGNHEFVGLWILASLEAGIDVDEATEHVGDFAFVAAGLRLDGE